MALEKNCYFLNLWEVLADENGDLKAEYAQPDGYHLKPEATRPGWITCAATRQGDAARALRYRMMVTGQTLCVS
mgnify:FL=1